MKRLIAILTALALLPVLMGAGASAPDRKASSKTSETVVKRPAVTELRPETTVEAPITDVITPDQKTANQAPNYFMDWWSVNGGGDVNASSASYQMGLSVGQSVAGAASSASYNMGIGFWYGAAPGGGACPVTMTGDVNVSGSITSADIIYLVGYVFKGGSAPMPCEAAGDVNCTGSVTSADIIYLVGYVFKGGTAPCDVCALIPGTWTCP